MPMTSTKTDRPPDYLFAKRRAFSLGELLVVVAVMALLMVFSLPMLPSILDGSRVSRVAGDIALLLEQSRTTAMARNTYVWIGIADVDDDLKIAIVEGTTGQPGDLGAGNIVPVEKVRTYEDFRTALVTGLAGMETGGEDIGGSLFGSFTQASGGSDVSFPKVIQFNPRGEASLRSDSLSRWIDIGLVPLKGGKPNDLNKVAFQVSGLSGQVRTFRQ